MKLVAPIILTIISIAVFMLFASPTYKDISALKTEVASYDEALTNSNSLKQERDKLTKKKSSFNLEDLQRLEKLLPENVDNIRLILEIEQIAAPYGMALRNVQYNATNSPEDAAMGGIAQNVTKQSNKNYGVMDLEFTTAGTYDNFLKFTRDLESNLRIVDISSIIFSSNTTTNINQPSASEIYEYNFKIRTYWLKN